MLYEFFNSTSTGIDMLYLHLSVADLMPHILYLYLDKLGDLNKHFKCFIINYRINTKIDQGDIDIRCVISYHSINVMKSTTFRLLLINF